VKPSAAAVLDLLRAHPEGVTSLEAPYAGCGSRLAGRIHELRRDGHDVRSAYVTTDNGARIVRYSLVAPRPEPTSGVQEAWL
jgi:hypothetical protein